MRILHTADIHWCREHRAEALASLESVRDTAEREHVDLVVLAGDLFDRGIQASDRDGLPELLQVIAEILDVAPIAAVSGTPTHDVAGCYEVLTRLQAKHNFVVLYPSTAYAVYQPGHYLAPWGQREESYDSPVALILGCPEPGKEWLLAEKEGLGSAEATQAVADSMRALLLGLGGMRREHPELPAIMVYHGAIVGARMGSGQIVGSNELAVGVEDLALVGADYYALGHIHEPQIVSTDDARMVYAGSAYPVDWGELEQKTFNLVELRMPSEASVVTRIPFPHPPRMKVESDGVNVDLLLDDHGMPGKQVWLVVRNTRENLADLNEEAMLSYLLHAGGALPGSRVTFEPILVETVRAAEITEAASLRDKVTVWASASSLPEPSGRVLAKAGALEAEARAAGQVGEGAYIRLRRLRLRGAIGIWKGLGVDEVTLDLDDYEKGLIALVGPNGAGKSTIIENLHPFGRMLTRGGSLQSHFRLKDSCRELVWTDERDGTTYRALILIDPTLTTPKAEYHLHVKDVGGQWQPITNGRREDYDEQIGKLWGSIEMFCRSAFVAQKPPRGMPDLADATPAERKALFRELGGLDYLATYAEAAKGKADTIDSDIEIDRGKASVIRPLLEQEADRVLDLGRAQTALAEARIRVGVIRADGKQQRALVEKLEAAAREQRDIVQKRQALLEEHGRLGIETQGIDRTIRLAEMALSGRAAAADVIQKAEELRHTEAELREEGTGVLRERERLAREHADRVAAVRKARDAIAAEIARLARAMAALEAKKAGLVVQVDALSAEVARPMEETCPTCGQTLPEAARMRLGLERTNKRRALGELQEAILGLDNLLIANAEGQKAQEGRLAGLTEPPAPALPAFERKPELDRVLAELVGIDLAAARETVQKADAAQAQMDSGRARQGQIAARLAEIEAERAKLLALVDETVAVSLAEAKVKLDALHEQYAEATGRVSRLEAEVKNLASILEDLAHKRKSLQEIEQGIAAAQAELEDWRYLERACGRDGIQALELDAMGPSIAETANGLLDAAYGSRFRVEIRTTRIAGRGSRTKQVEDFEIVVRDTEAGTEQPLDTLSGGEVVWIRKALYAAFGIIRARSTGTRFLTTMLDEADGALDPDARRRYVAMLQAEHRATGRAHTIVITHSESAQEAIGERIEMRDLAREGVRV